MSEAGDDTRMTAMSLLGRVADLFDGQGSHSSGLDTDAQDHGPDIEPVAVASLLHSNEPSRRRTEAVTATARATMLTSRLHSGSGLAQPLGLLQVSPATNHRFGHTFPPAGQFCVVFPEETPTADPSSAALRRRADATAFLGKRGAIVHSMLDRPCALLVEAERDDVLEVATRFSAIVSPRHTKELQPAAEYPQGGPRPKGFARTIAQGRDVIGLTPYGWGVAPGAK